MLVDTSVWIDFFNGYASPESDRLAQAITDAEPLVIPGLVWTEVLLGFRRDADAERIASLLEAFEPIQEPSRADYIEAARMYRVCRNRGYTIRSTIDCVLAQLYLRDDRVLLSKDRDFRAIAACFPLRLVSV